MVQVFASHHTLDPSDQVPGMPIEYVYYFAHEAVVSEFEKKITELEHQIAVLERVTARQDAMLVAKDEYEGG